MRIVTGYGPQLHDSEERKQKFWEYLEREAGNADRDGAGFILQMDSNCHVGKEVIKDDVNEQNANGRLFVNFLERMPQLSLINSLSLCEGLITRKRKTVRGLEMSILDFFVTCDKVLPYIRRMKIDEQRENTLTNFGAFKRAGKVIETDHNPVHLEVMLDFSASKPERLEFFQFKDINSQLEFKRLTSVTTEFTKCFENDMPFELQAKKWRNTLNSFFHKSFKKVRITNKPQQKNSMLFKLLNKRSQFKKKKDLDEKEEEELYNLEALIAEECEDENRKKVMENFHDMNGDGGNLSHQGIWKTKRKYFPKIKPNIPVGKKNLKGQLMINPEELKSLYLETFKFRMRKRPVRPGYEDLLEKQEKLFNLRLLMARKEKSPPWRMCELEAALKNLKSGKCRDPDGLIRELFKENVLGDNLKKSMLIMYNKIKETGKIPDFMRLTNISAIYKGRGEKASLESDWGIFLVSLFRTIMMTMIYLRKYDIVEENMSDSNIGARKRKNIRNHIFVVNSVIHDVLSRKSKEPVDIMVMDYKQMFDSECLFECMNDLFEAGVTDDEFDLIYEANRDNFVAVQTPNGLSERDTFNEIVMQGDVLAPLISSLQLDTIGKECMDQGKHLYYFKDTVPIPPLGMVDDLFTISTCGFKTTMMNQFLNSKTAMKRLQFGTTKCVKMHMGRTCNETLCKDLFVDSWNLKVEIDPVSGKCVQHESFGGQDKMEEKQEQVYLGDVISVDGRHDKNVKARKDKSVGTINQIMQILESTFYGKYYFEVALVLRSSLLLSSLLLNSEAWVNLTDKNIRALEQTDEILLTKILGCDSNTSNVFKYLELGIYPVRFEIMKRKILFLHYLLQQEKNSSFESNKGQSS